MASGKDFKVRIKSITSIKKITQAMKMVAASKLRVVQMTLEKCGRGIHSFIDSLDDFWVFGSESSYIFLVVIGSDRGLCGGVNSSVTKEVKSMFVKLKDKGKKVYFITIGDKVKDILSRTHRDYLLCSFSDISKKTISISTLLFISDFLCCFSSESVGFVYMKFKSVISQVLCFDQLLPVLLVSSGDRYEHDLGRNTLISFLYGYYIFILFYLSNIESLTSEQGARMNAMDSASRNASEMIDKLTLIYNKARQSAITSELIEIISCASAVAGK